MKLTNDTFIIYAAKAYNNPGCLGIEEFHEDVNRFKYLQKLLKRYVERDDLQDRLILNHIITIFNVFSFKHAIEMCFFKTPTTCHAALKTFLIYLNYMRLEDRPEIQFDFKIYNILKQY